MILCPFFLGAHITFWSPWTANAFMESPVRLKNVFQSRYLHFLICHAGASANNNTYSLPGSNWLYAAGFVTRSESSPCGVYFDHE